MFSTAEAELGALYTNTKQTALMQQMLVKMSHLQLLMPIQMDDSTAYSIVTNKIIPKAMKAMDIGFYWLCKCEQQQQFWYYWHPEK